MPPQIENLTSQERPLPLGKVFAGLGERAIQGEPSQDAVCAISAKSAEMKLSGVGARPPKKGAIGEDAKWSQTNEQKNAQRVIEIIQNLKDVTLEKQLLAEQLLQLPSAIQHQLEHLGLSGLMINITGGDHGREASSIAMTAILYSISQAQPNTSVELLIKDGLTFANFLISKYNSAKRAEITQKKQNQPKDKQIKSWRDSTCAASLVLIDKQGKAFSFSSGANETVIISADGKANTIGVSATQEIGNTGIPTSNFKIEDASMTTFDTKDISQVIISKTGTANRINSNQDLKGKSISEIGKALTKVTESDGKPVNGGSVTAGEFDKKTDEKKAASDDDEKKNDKVDVSEVLKHKLPIWADMTEWKPVDPDSYKKATTDVKFYEEELTEAGIDAAHLPSYLHVYKQADGSYAGSINLFEANSQWVNRVVDTIKSQLPKQAGESDSAYQQRLFQTIHEQLQYEGDHLNDPIRQVIDKVNNPVSKLFAHSMTAEELVTIEVMMEGENRVVDAAERQRLLDGRRAQYGNEPVDDLRSTVAHRGEQVVEEGDYMHRVDKVKDKDGKEINVINEQAQADVLAARLMIEWIRDLKPNYDVLRGKGLNFEEGKTFGQIREEMNAKIRSASTPQDRAKVLSEYNQFRLYYYGLIQEVIGNRGTGSAKNINGENELAVEKRLKLFTAEKGMQLYKDHLGVNSGWTEGTKQLLIKGGESASDRALKGIGMYIRLIREPLPELSRKEPRKIYQKRFVQSEGELLTIITNPPPVEPPVEPPVKPPVKEPPVRPPVKEPPVKPPVKEPSIEPPVKEPPKRPGQPEHPAPAPGQPEKDKPPRRPGQPEPAPGQPKEDKPPTTETPPTQEVEKEMILGAVAEEGRWVQDVFQKLEAVSAHDLKDFPVPGYAKIPVLGGILWAARHPVKMIWQNSIARSLFEQQRLRFSSDVSNIFKTAVGDRSIPAEVTEQLLYKALDEGRALKKGEKNIFKKLWRMGTDQIKGITGFGQTSEQLLAKKWLKEQLTTGNSLVIDSKTRALTEQDEHGKGFATWTKGMTFEQSNRYDLQANPNLRRYELNKETQSGLIKSSNEKIKGFIKAYAIGTLSDEQLVIEVNKYFMGDFRSQLTPEQQRDFSAPEMSSNIKSIAEAIKANPKYFQAGENGKTPFDELQIKIVFGRENWGGVRGNKEMSKFTEFLAKRMAKRELMRGTGLLNYAVGLAQDAVTFGGAYVGGGALSALAFGPSSLARMAGGFAGVGAMAGLKETGFGLSGLGIKGFKGRYASEVEQLSREAARGRLSTTDTRIREEMSHVLVDRVKVTDRVAAINDLIKQSETSQLNEADAQKLLMLLAQTDARMRLSNLAGMREVNFKVQNYFEFTEGNENQEYTALRGAISQGMTKLLISPAGKTLLSAQQIKYHQTNAMGVFDKYSALAEAQLRVGNKNNRDGVKNWIKSAYNISETDAEDMMNNMFPGFDLGVSKDKSLVAKENLLRKLAIKRGVATAGRAMIMGGAVGVAAPVVTGEVGNLLQDIKSTGGDIRLGLQDYAQDWGKVLGGDVPVNTSGGITADLSPLQRGVLIGRAYIEPPHWPPGRISLHTENIDGVTVNLPAGLRHIDIPGKGDYFVDPRTGNIWDMSDSHFGKIDIDGDGTLDLAMVNDVTGVVTPADAALGLKIVDGPPIISKSTIDILQASPAARLVTVDGHSTNIPAGTEWIKDASANKWDLVVSSDHSKVIINDAQFDTSGRMTYDAAGSVGHYTEVTSAVSGKSINVLTPKGEIDPNGEWGLHKTNIDHRVWHTQDQLKMYDWKVVPAAGGNAQVVIDSHAVGTIQGIGGQEGLYFSLPGHANEGIFVPFNANHQITLDQNSTQVIPGSNGLTIGQLSRMVLNQDNLKTFTQASEFTHRPDIFNLAIGGKPGYIETASLDGNTLHVGATITGTHGISSVISGPPATTITPTISIDKITDTVTKSTPTFDIASPEIEINASIPLIPVPSRQNIERSYGAGEKPLVETPTEKKEDKDKKKEEKKPLTEQEIQEKKHQKEELIKERDKIKEKMESYDEKSGQPQSEEIKRAKEEQQRRLGEIEKELGEIEEVLSGSTPPEEDEEHEITVRDSFNKEQFIATKNNVVKILQEKSLEDINAILKALNLSQLDQAQLEELKSDEVKRKLLIIDIILANERKNLGIEVKSQIFKKELADLPKNDQIAVELYNREQEIADSESQLSQYKNPEAKKRAEQAISEARAQIEEILSANPEVKKLNRNKIAKEFYAKIDAIYDSKYKAQIEASVAKYKAQIEAWEAEAVVPPVKKDEEINYNELEQKAKRILEAKGPDGRSYKDRVIELIIDKDKAIIEKSGADDEFKFWSLFGSNRVNLGDRTIDDILEIDRHQLEQALSTRLVKDTDVVGDGDSHKPRKNNEFAYQDKDIALRYFEVLLSQPQEQTYTTNQLMNFYIGRLFRKLHRNIVNNSNEPVLHRMASLAAVLKLIDDGDITDDWIAKVKKNT